MPRFWKGGAKQAAEKPYNAVILSPFAVILSIDSLAAAQDGQKLGPKCQHADGASKASWLSATQFFTPCKGTR
jgi:hypothetical protein